MATLKVAVVGAGAMGSLFGGSLAASGHEVWLIDVWKEHVEAINKNGLTIEEVGGRERLIKDIKATTDPREVGTVDLVLVFVKSALTEEAARGALPLFGGSTTAITLQNGLGNVEKIASVVGEERVTAGVTSHGSTMLGPGKIRHAGVGETLVGELDGRITDRIRRIADALNSAGIEAKVTENIQGAIWGKLIVNVGINPLTALTGLLNGQLLDFKETQELLEMVVEEAAEVAKKKGIRLTYDDPVSHVKEVCRLTAANKSSMLQDVMNKRRTEIDVINGAIVKEGEKVGISTPANKVVTNLISVIQQNYKSK